MRAIIALLAAFLCLALVGATSESPARERGLSLHMLPNRVASLSGAKGGFTPTLPGGKPSANAIQTAEELKTYFRSLDKVVQDNGIWIVTTHPDAYSDEEKKLLDDVRTLCLKESIPLFICRGSKLKQPDGWRRISSPEDPLF